MTIFEPKQVTVTSFGSNMAIFWHFSFEKLFREGHRIAKSGPIIKPILKTCLEKSNWPRKTISTYSKTLIGSSYKFCFREPYFGSLNKKAPKYGHFWSFFVCENVFDEPWGPLEVILSPNWYWKRVQGHRIDLGRWYQHIPTLWSGRSKNIGWVAFFWNG